MGIPSGRKRQSGKSVGQIIDPPAAGDLNDQCPINADVPEWSIGVYAIIGRGGIEESAGDSNGEHARIAERTPSPASAPCRTPPRRALTVVMEISIPPAAIISVMPIAATMRLVEFSRMLEILPEGIQAAGTEIGSATHRVSQASAGKRKSNSRLL